MPFVAGNAYSRLRSAARSVGFCLVALLVLTVIGPAAHAEVHWRSGTVSSPFPMQPAELAQATAQLMRRPGQSRIVIHFDGPVQPQQRAALESRGIRLLSYLGGHAYFAGLTAGADPAGFAAVPGTFAVEPIDPANKLHPDLALGVVHPWTVVGKQDATRAAPVVAVYVLFHRDFDLNRANELLNRHGGTLRSEMGSINGVVAHIALDRMTDLAADDDVMYVEPPLPAWSETNDGNRVRTESDLLNAAPYGLDGSGVTVMVYDGGKVYRHSDLAGRLNIGRSDGGEISDHATHVACTIGGDGGQYSGMAPGVAIVSYAFEQPAGPSEGALYTDPGDLEADYSEAISLYGADLSNNSISTNTAFNGFPCSWEGNYGTTGALIDAVVRGSPRRAVPHRVGQRQRTRLRRVRIELPHHAAPRVCQEPPHRGRAELRRRYDHIVHVVGAL